MAIARARSADMVDEALLQPHPAGRPERLRHPRPRSTSPGTAPARSSPGTTTRPRDVDARTRTRQWMNSPGHKAIVVSTSYNYVGVGLAIDASTGKKIWTAVYIKGPDRTGARATISEADGRRRRDRRDSKRVTVTLDRRGRPAPGPDVRLPLTSRSSGGSTAAPGRRSGRARRSTSMTLDARRRPHATSSGSRPATRPATGAPGRRSGDAAATARRLTGR